MESGPAYLEAAAIQSPSPKSNFAHFGLPASLFLPLREN
jgi:hypothetical protein